MADDYDARDIVGEFSTGQHFRLRGHEYIWQGHISEQHSNPDYLTAKVWNAAKQTVTVKIKPTDHISKVQENKGLAWFQN